MEEVILPGPRILSLFKDLVSLQISPYCLASCGQHLKSQQQRLVGIPKQHYRVRIECEEREAPWHPCCTQGFGDTWKPPGDANLERFFSG